MRGRSASEPARFTRWPGCVPPRHDKDPNLSVTDQLLANNAVYAENFTGPLPLPPAKHVTVVACMDARAGEAFTDLDVDVRQSVGRIKADPFVVHKENIRGFVFDVATGKRNEVV
ncbi:hypothetical protein [Streptomyces sp. NPDC093093]|uniref:hypothetical protein n=1 Tax=Streptomyces sp. NPDC093093 TaxID=3366025 RepID=UPI0038167B11